MSGKKVKGTKTLRQRNSIFFYVSNVLGCYELCVGYKNTKGVVQPLSASQQAASIKVPFGPLKSCEFRKRNISVDELLEEFKFVNSKLKILSMPASLLNNLEFQDGEFSRKVTELYVGKKKELLAKYLTLINQTKEFINHEEDIHDSDGMLLSGDGLTAMLLL